MNETNNENMVTVDRETFEYLMALNGRAEAVATYLSAFVNQSYSVNIALAIMMLGNVRHFGNDPVVMIEEIKEDA